MKLAFLLIYCASAFFSKFTESATCVATTGLAITVKNDTVTTVYPDGIILSAYVNYPKDSVFVSYQTGTSTSANLIFPPSREDPCRYDAQLSYTAYVENGLTFTVTFSAADMSGSSKVSDVTTVLVEVEAEVSTTSDSSCALVGEIAELVCQAIGNPIPTITWSSSDNGIASTSYKQPDFPGTVSATANLRFSNVTFQDHEEYTCTVNNTVGSPPSNVTDFKTFNLDVNIAPVLISSTSDMKVDYGNSANLSCMFQAYPLPIITWSSDNSDGYEITEVDSGQYYRTTTLEIQSVTCNYVTQYYCEASNTVCGNAMQIRSENTTIDITEPAGVENLQAVIPQCAGNNVSLSWDEPASWTDESNYYITVNSTYPQQYITKENNFNITNLAVNTVYEFQVTVVLCNVTSVPATITKRTAVVGIPSSPINVTQAMSTNYKMCNITWIEPSVNYGAIENYEIIYYSCQVNTNDCGESFIVNTNETSYEIDMTTPNSEYYVSVSAITCAGKGENTAVNDINCISDTAAPPSAAIPNPGNGGTSVSTSSTSINVTIEPADTENGALSCYFLVMIRYSEGSNPERLELNSSYPVDQIAQANDSVNDNEPYFVIASEESGIFTVGNDLTSQCNIRGTSSTARSTTTSFTAKSRSLENGRTYDMFELTSTPSQYSDKVYYGVSDPVMILVTEIDNYDVPVVAIVVPIVVVVIILIVVGIGIWYYKKKNNQTKENLNSVQYNTEDVSRNDYKYDQKETTNYCENSGKSTARVSPTYEE